MPQPKRPRRRSRSAAPRRTGGRTPARRRQPARTEDLRLLTETIPHMLWSARPDGMVDYVNQRVLDYAALPYDQFLGIGWGKAIHPDHVERMAQAWAASVRTGDPFQFEFLGRHAPSQSWRWCVSSALAARDASGRVIKWYGSIVDLHDRKVAEETRLEAERQYRVVVETATDAVVTIDEASTILLVNPAINKIFGYAPSELVGKPLTVLMPERLASRHLGGLGRYVHTGTRRLNWAAIELIGVHKDGSEFPVEVSFAEVVQHGRRLFTGFIRDISERRQAEELREAHARQTALRADISSALASESSLRGMLSACADAIVAHLETAFARVWILAPDGRTLELQASAGIYRHLDGPHGRIPFGHLKIGQIAEDRTPHYTNDVAHDPRISNHEWARAEGMVAFAGYPLLAGDRVIGVMATFSRRPIPGATAETLTVIADALAQGIQRKQAEEDVKRSEAFLAEAQAVSRTGSWGWNTATGALFWSRETFRILGLDPAVQPTLATVAGLIHPDDRRLFEHDTDMLARDRTDFEREYRLVLADGSRKWVQVVGRSLPGRFADLDFIGSIMDVTERKQSDEALVSAQADLAEMTRLMTMGELAASIAHEINQPLATVVTNAQACARLLGADAPPLGEITAAITDIADAGKRASDVIAKIRLLLRKGMPEPTSLDLNEIIGEVIALTRDDTTRRGVLLRTELAADLPPVRGDRVQLQQVLINLLANALDALAHVNDRLRGVVVRTTRHPSREVEVAVIDAGTGIDPKLHSRLFDPFFTTKIDGMGMGLAICRNIIEALGGRLEAANNLDVGATVRFVLPAAGRDA